MISIFKIIREKDSHALKTLLPYVDVNQTDGEGKTPIIVAAMHGSVDMINILFECKSIDPNIQDQNGLSALHLAKGKETVEVLLKHEKVDPNVKDVYGFTALHVNVQNRIKENLWALLQHKDIDIHVKTKDGRTPIDMASKDILDILLAHQEKQKKNENLRDLIAKMKDLINQFEEEFFSE